MRLFIALFPIIISLMAGQISLNTLYLLGYEPYSVFYTNRGHLWHIALYLAASFALFSLSILLLRKGSEKRDHRHNNWLAYLLLLSVALSFILAHDYISPLSFALAGQYSLHIAAVLLLFFLSVLLLVAFLNRHSQLLEKNAQQAQLLLKSQQDAEYYAQLKEFELLLHKEKHEAVDQLKLCLQLLDEGQQAEARGFLQAKLSDYETLTPLRLSKWPALNALLRLKKHQAEKNSVEFLLQIEAEELCPLSERDLCSVLLNLLNNALEAVVQTQAPHAVRVLLRPQRQMYFIRVSNKSSGHYCYDEDELVSTKSSPGHGIGLRSVKWLLKKYDGQLVLDAESGIFVATAIVPMTLDKEGSTSETALGLN